jgi:hypothetical protein
MASVVSPNSGSTPSAYVPESIAADIQKAVKMANDTSKFIWKSDLKTKKYDTLIIVIEIVELIVAF